MALFADGNVELGADEAAQLVANLRDLGATAAAKIEQQLGDNENPIVLTIEEAQLVVIALERDDPRRSAFASRQLREALYARLGYPPPSGH